MKNLLITSVNIISLIALLISCQDKKEEWIVSSPSGNIEFSVSFDEHAQLFYSVFKKGSSVKEQVIGSSPLGILRSDASFVQHLHFISQGSIVSIDETFALPTGKRKTMRNQANEMTLTFENDKADKIQIIARASNDGVAFRYCFPDKDSTTVYSVEQEMTGFSIKGNGKTWLQPYDKITMWSPGYERYFENGIPIGTSAPSIEGWAFPALFQTENAWMLLTEAAVDSTYFAAHLQPKADSGLYVIRMPEVSEANNTVTHIPASTLPWATPWRVVIVGENLSDIVESDMVVKLNPPSQISDPSWIKPGRSSWSWWSDAGSSKNFTSLKKFVDLSAEMGWEYSLVDANWDIMKGGTIEQLVDYARTKNIGILMWYNSGGAHNSVTERPRDIMSNDIERKEEFKKLAAWGVKGIKVDFFQSDKPKIIKQYLDILKDAADNKILVNFHGCTLPRGWNRTWPNLIGMEAVKGAENYAFDSLYTSHAVWHNTILPFTRNVVGSMDYTPVTFSNQRYPHATTYAHELALAVVFENGILHIADKVEAILSLPEAPKTFLKTVPVAWDSTVLLAGYPGKDCIIARRSNSVWYIGGINGTNEKQKWDIDLSRLKGNSFSASVITDGKTNQEFSSSDFSIASGKKLIVEVLPFGGFVATLK